MFPIGLLKNAQTLMDMTAEANAVVSMRIGGMMGIWSVTDHENTRMVEEKIDAMTDAQFAMWQSMMRGETPNEVVAAGLEPVRKTTRANAKRLTKRGFAKKD